MSKASVPFKKGLHEWLSKSLENQMEYLKISVEENFDIPEALLVALRDVAEVRGFEKLAIDSGLSQKSLYKILSDKKDAKPRLETIHQILQALGLQLTVKVISKKRKMVLR